MVKRKGGNKKGQVLHLSEFLGDAAPLAPTQPSPVYTEECSTDLSVVPQDVLGPAVKVDLSALPSAPRAQREGSFDPSKIPRQPPYTAYVGNLPFDSEDDDVIKMFQRNTVKEVRLLKDKETGHFKGFGYVEFESPDGLIEALKLNEKMIRGRPIKVDVATQAGQNSSGDRWERGRSNEGRDREPYVDKTSDDWRRDVRPQEDAENAPVPYTRRRDYGDREQRGTGERYNSQDSFSRSDFGTKINDAPKEPYKLEERRGPRRDREDRSDNPWVRRGEDAHRDREREERREPREPRERPENPWVRRGRDEEVGGEEEAPPTTERPRLNLKARTVPLTEEQLQLKAAEKAAAEQAAVAAANNINERLEPDGRENKPKLNPFGAAKPADTAAWRSSRIQGTGPIKTPVPQVPPTGKGKDNPVEIINDTNKFMVLEDGMDDQLQ